MDDNIRFKLEAEQAMGEQYERTYTNIVQPFMERKRAELFSVFQDLPTSNSDDLLTVKLQCNALSMLEDEFKHYIQTGQLAKQQLTEGEENE